MVQYSLDSFLDEFLSDDKVVSDLRQILSTLPAGVIELDAGTIRVEPECQVELVSKSCISQRFDRGFGSCFTALVAVGGVSNVEYGIVAAHHCFAVLWYSPNLELITIDFTSVCP